MSAQRIALIFSLLSVACVAFALWWGSQALNATLEKQAESNRQFLTETVEAMKALQPQPTAAPVPTPTPNVLPDAAPTTPPVAGNTVANIFDEQNIDSDTAAKIDKLKADFESLFVTYQYLAKCGLADDIDYHIINSALAHQMSSLNAPGRTQFDILTAAKGTYDEIYSRSLCDTPDIGTMQQQFKNYLQEAQKNRFVM